MENLKDAKPKEGQIIEAAYKSESISMARKPMPSLIDAVKDEKAKEILIKAQSWLVIAFIAFLVILFGMTLMTVFLNIAGIKL